MREISIILVTHNSSGQIADCLDSIFEQEYKDYELIVVDNVSEDDTKQILRNKNFAITLIENFKNYGYSKALNQGIARAIGKFILCLNDDIKLSNNFLKNIHNAIENQERVGAVQPKVFRPDGKIIDTTGIFLSFLRRFYDVGSGRFDGAEFSRPKLVFGACDAAALYRKEALETIRQGEEYFDEDFFGIVEDVDISWRMQKKGWKILYYPEAICFHNGGVSRRKDKLSQFFTMRNRYLLLLKNESLLGLLRLPFVFLAYDLWRNLYMLLFNPRHFLKASSDIIKLSPKMLKKRIFNNFVSAHEK